jgi:hypothetical protein
MLIVLNVMQQIIYTKCLSVLISVLMVLQFSLNCVVIISIFVSKLKNCDINDPMVYSLQRV